jgi:hypothetical protein
MCTHTQTRFTCVDCDTGEMDYTSVEYHTTEDIDVHRYKCTQCDKVYYYSGRAKNHFENGTSYEIAGLN